MAEPNKSDEDIVNFALHILDDDYYEECLELEKQGLLEELPKMKFLDS